MAETPEEYNNTLGVIGAGNMGGAIAGAFSADSARPVRVFDIDEKKASGLAGEINGVADVTLAETASSCKYILLAVKPQNLAALLADMANSITDGTVFISICAGIDFAFIERNIGRDRVKVVRAMPNMAAKFGLSATAICRNESVLDDEFAFVTRIFDSCGMTVEIMPEQMNDVIPLNGSSPAFIYRFVEGFLGYAEEVGFDSGTAVKLIAQSLRGAAKTLERSGKSADELIRQVCSPGGTTIAGLEAGQPLCSTVKEMCISCKKRADELQR